MRTYCMRNVEVLRGDVGSYNKWLDVWTGVGVHLGGNHGELKSYLVTLVFKYFNKGKADSLATIE